MKNRNKQFNSTEDSETSAIRLCGVRILHVTGWYYFDVLTSMTIGLKFEHPRKVNHCWFESGSNQYFTQRVLFYYARFEMGNWYMSLMKSARVCRSMDWEECKNPLIGYWVWGSPSLWNQCSITRRWCQQTQHVDPMWTNIGPSSTTLGQY